MFSASLRVGVGAALVVLGLSVMCGWIFGVVILTSVLPGWPNMKFNPALCFVLLGLAFILIQRPRAPARIGAVICAIAIAAIAGATVAEYLSGHDFGIDQLVVADRGSYSGSGLPGRMSPLSALNFVLEGIALILLSVARRRPSVRLAHVMGLCAGLAAFFTAAGYAFGAETLGRLGLYKLMAIHTALAHTAACMVIVTIRAHDSWLAGYEQAPAARAGLLRFLPVSVGLPTVIGLALLLGAGLGHYDAEFALTLFVPLVAVLLIALGLRAGQHARDGEIALRTSQAQLEESRSELARFNRVTLLGEMTASISHEINQPISGAITNANAALHWLAAEPPNVNEVRQSLERIVKDGHRASEVIARVRALARKAPPTKGPLDINDAVGEVLALTERDMQTNSVELSLRLSRELPRVPADRIQIQQVILNLVMNAIEAMSGGSEGQRQLFVSTGPDSFHVFVEVRDTGSGLQAAEIERLFQSFYTTKEGGMGMGLSLSRSIVEAHGGSLSAAPNEPKGAIFRFTLPVVELLDHASGHVDQPRREFRRS